MADKIKCKKEPNPNDITRGLANRFPSFGGGWVTPGNPISAALRDVPPCFAAGVDIREVVDYVLAYGK